MSVSILLISGVVILKFLFAILIYFFPFLFSWLNFVLDSIDGDVLMHFGMSWHDYTQVDKIADYVTYIVMFVVGRRWRIGKTITFLFLFRTVGQLLFFSTQNDLLLFIFPNFLEPLFMVFSALLFFKKKDAYKTYKKWIVPIWIFIISYKMWNEYNIHVGHIDLSEKYFGFNN